MRLALGIAAAVAGVVPQKAVARDVCHTQRCEERVAANQCSNARPRPCVRRAIITYKLTGWQARWMWAIPSCESGWDPLAYFSRQHADTLAERRFAEAEDRSAGLYSFKPSTWNGLRRYRHHSQWYAKWNALGAALMVRTNRTGEWACKA